VRFWLEASELEEQREGSGIFLEVSGGLWGGE